MEIGPEGGTIDAATQTRLSDLVARETAATAGTPPKLAVRAHVYGSYVDEPLMSVIQGQRYYLHSNHLYSISAVTDSTGGVVERYRYDAYGRQTVLDTSGNPVVGGSTIGQAWGFTGRRLDPETGLDYFRHRMYSPGEGRFIGRDPNRQSAKGNLAGDGYQDGYNLYAGWYVPGHCDPYGLEACGPDLTDMLVAHLNRYLSGAGGRIAYNNPNSWDYADALVYTGWYLQPTARENGETVRLGIMNSPCTCYGSFTLAGKCFSSYHIDHVLILGYVALGFGVDYGRTMGNLNEYHTSWRGWSSNRQPGNYDPPEEVHPSDLAFNEIPLGAFANMGGNKTLTRADFVASMNKLTPGDYALIGLKPSFNQTDPPTSYTKCKPSTTRPDPSIINQLTVPPLPYYDHRVNTYNN